MTIDISHKTDEKYYPKRETKLEELKESVYIKEK